MEFAFAAADVVICRAGATTLAELTRLGKSAILIPYPYASADHQTYNARTLAEAGAAIVIKDGDVKTKLKNELLSLIHDENKMNQMRACSRELGRPNAGREIARRILDIAAT